MFCQLYKHKWRWIHLLELVLYNGADKTISANCCTFSLTFVVVFFFFLDRKYFCVRIKKLLWLVIFDVCFHIIRHFMAVPVVSVWSTLSIIIRVFYINHTTWLFFFQIFQMLFYITNETNLNSQDILFEIWWKKKIRENHFRSTMIVHSNCNVTFMNHSHMQNRFEMYLR